MTSKERVIRASKLGTPTMSSYLHTSYQML